MGYSLSGDISGQCLFILYGTEAYFFECATAAVRRLCCSTGTKTFMKKTGDHSNDIARLKGACLVTTTEVRIGKDFE